MSGFADMDTDTLNVLRANLTAGLDKVAAAIDNGTFHTVAAGKSSSPSQAGLLTLALLVGVDAELTRRETL
jgi:hypothetical protein